MNAAVDLVALKERQQATWASGDYAVIGTTLQIVGERLAEALDLRWDERVLDVAAGNGNATLAAARRGCAVVSTDYVPALLERGAERARAEGLAVQFRVADAEALPFEDGEFDAVLSTFGVMFCADHARAARELVRVCRPGGRIGLANWTPDSLVGQLFATVARFVPPPKIPAPSSWGSTTYLERLFDGHVGAMHVQTRTFEFRYRSAGHFVEQFRQWYGPVLKAFAALPTERAMQLGDELVRLLTLLNRGGPRSLVVPSEYLEVVIERR